MKWVTHADQYCDEFLEFADNTCDDSAITCILESICELGNGEDVIVTEKLGLDREGLNREIVGYIIQGDDEYGFKVRDGNWNGTEVVAFGFGERYSVTDFSDYY